MQADGHGRGLVHGFQIQIVVDVQDETAHPRINFAAPIGNAVYVGAFQRGKTGIKALGSLVDPMNRDVVRQHTLQPARQRDHWRHIHVPNATGEYGFRDVQMAYLMRGVHTGIGTSRNGQTERFPRIIDGHAQHGVQYALDLPLHGTPIRLLRPTEEAATIVCQVDS